MASDELRLSNLETGLRRLQSQTPTTVTSSSTTTSGREFVSVPEEVVTFTKDGADHDITISSVPSSAVAIRLYLEVTKTSTVRPIETFTVWQTGSSDTFKIASVKCDLGSNNLTNGFEVNPEVGRSFTYNIGSDASWSVIATLQGYYK